MLWIRSGNDGTSQTTAVQKVVGATGGVQGQRIVYEVLGYASGDERTFKPSHRFRVNELRPYVNGIAAGEPVVQDGESWTTDFWPTTRSIIAASYVIEQGG